MNSASSAYFDISTLKYSSSGELQWIRIFNQTNLSSIVPSLAASDNKENIVIWSRVNSAICLRIIFQTGSYQLSLVGFLMDNHIIHLWGIWNK